MAITTIDQALAGMQYPREFVKAVTGTMVAGRPHSLFYLAGIPGAGVAPSPGIGGEVLTALSGQIPFTNPVSGNSYLARLQAMATQAGSLLLCDRLWQNSGISITTTTEQTFTGAAQIPARDGKGLNEGWEVYGAIEVSAATGAGVPTPTLKYTNESNVADKVGANIVACVASSIAGTFHPFGLAAGDKGIRKAQSITLGVSWTSGTIHVVLYRVLARVELTVPNVPNAIDALTSGFPRLYDNTVPFLVFIPNAVTTSNITGHVIWTQG
jgi:hypothetical protein